MSRKADFNAEEWATVVNGPLHAGLLVSAAERGGRVREVLAMGRVYQDARQRLGENELLDELMGSPPAIDAEQIRTKQAELPEFVSEQLREAVRILERRASGADLDAYKRFVMTVAQAAADAHREGGFLGLGGHQISEAENRALDEISRALGAPPEGATIT